MQSIYLAINLALIAMHFVLESECLSIASMILLMTFWVGLVGQLVLQVFQEVDFPGQIKTLVSNLTLMLKQT